MGLLLRGRRDRGEERWGMERKGKERGGREGAVKSVKPRTRKLASLP